MREKQINKLKAMLVAAAALAAIVMFPIETRAVVACSAATSTADSDGDGFSDLQECTGITLANGTAFPGANSSAVPRAARLDPNSKDLFIIAVRANPTFMPASMDPYRFIAGLGITVHEINDSQAPNRQVTTGQLAARIAESLARATTTDKALGASNQGLLLDNAAVWTQRIVDLVNSVCVSGTTCVDSLDSTINTRALVIDNYIRHTIAHEVGGHSLSLAPDYNINFGGNHYQAGTKVLLEQTVTYSKKGTKVTWYISSAYTDPDKAAATLID